MANLAIKGHSTRGKEVIELLEMLGGVNTFHRECNNKDLFYYIDKNKHIQITCGSLGYTLFDLEEFEQKFPYKVGDKVKNARINDFIGRITNARWDNNEEQIIYAVEWNDTINSTLHYFARGLNLYKEETIEEININKMGFNGDKVRLILPDGYEFQAKGNEVFVIKKKPKYPKTFEECCEIMQVARSTIWFEYDDISSISNEGDAYEKSIENTLLVLRKLIICRDAYWKMAGDWREKRRVEEMHYIIYSTLFGEVLREDIPRHIANCLLDFPTKEMRDMFYENFKELIETVKELL